MNNKKDKLEDFKAAISSTVRSLSNSQKTMVSFGNQVSSTDKSSIKLPSLESFNNKSTQDIKETQKENILDNQEKKDISLKKVSESN